MNMARASTANPPGLSALIAEAEALRRNLFDSCTVVRTLSAMPPDPRRTITIESERARAVDMHERYTWTDRRILDLMTEGVFL